MPPCARSSATKRCDLGSTMPPRDVVVAQRQVLERREVGERQHAAGRGHAAERQRRLAVGVPERREPVAAPCSPRRRGRGAGSPARRTRARAAPRARALALGDRADEHDLAVARHRERRAPRRPRRAVASAFAAAPQRAVVLRRGGRHARRRASTPSRRGRRRGPRRGRRPTRGRARRAGPRAGRGGRGRCRRPAVAGPRGYAALASVVGEVDVAHHRPRGGERLVRGRPGCRARRRSSRPRRRCGSSGTPRGSRRARPRDGRAARHGGRRTGSRAPPPGRPRRSTAHSRSWWARMCPTTSSSDCRVGVAVGGQPRADRVERRGDELVAPRLERVGDPVGGRGRLVRRGHRAHCNPLTTDGRDLGRGPGDAGPGRTYVVAQHRRPRGTP